jgi:hypothetical protein
MSSILPIDSVDVATMSLTQLKDEAALRSPSRSSHWFAMRSVALLRTAVLGLRALDSIPLDVPITSPGATVRPSTLVSVPASVSSVRSEFASLQRSRSVVDPAIAEAQAELDAATAELRQLQFQCGMDASSPPPLLLVPLPSTPARLRPAAAPVKLLLYPRLRTFVQKRATAASGPVPPSSTSEADVAQLRVQLAAMEIVQRQAALAAPYPPGPPSRPHPPPSSQPPLELYPRIRPFAPKRTAAISGPVPPSSMEADIAPLRVQLAAVEIVQRQAALVAPYPPGPPSRPPPYPSSQPPLDFGRFQLEMNASPPPPLLQQQMAASSPPPLIPLPSTPARLRPAAAPVKLKLYPRIRPCAPQRAAAISGPVPPSSTMEADIAPLRVRLAAVEIVQRQAALVAPYPPARVRCNNTIAFEDCPAASSCVEVTPTPPDPDPGFASPWRCDPDLEFSSQVYPTFRGFSVPYIPFL